MKIIGHKHNMQFNVYLIYLLTLLVGHNILLFGRFSLPFYTTILMTFNMFFQKQYCYRMFVGKKEMHIYLLYVVIFLFCSFFNGDLSSGQGHLVSLLVKYWGCFLVFFYTNVYVKTLDDVKVVFNILILIVAFNSVVNLLQFAETPYGLYIYKFFNNVEQETFLDYMVNSGAEYGEVTSSIFTGIFASPVMNGYILASLGLFCMYYLFNKSRLIVKVCSFLVLVSVCISIFVVQQRSAFYLFALSLLFISLLSRKRIILFLIILFSIFYTVSNFDLELMMGRLFNFEDSTRDAIYNSAYEYVKSNFLFGGRINFSREVGYSSHNIIFNSLIYSGVLGSICIFIILYIMLKNIFYTYLLALRRKNISIEVLCGMGCAIYNLISFTHNNSLVTGDYLIWLLYILMSILIKKNGISKNVIGGLR